MYSKNKTKILIILIKVFKAKLKFIYGYIVVEWKCEKKVSIGRKAPSNV